MKHSLVILLTALAAGVAPAQLKPDQKLADFQNLAALFAKQYAPYEWKRDAIGFDLRNLGPWLERVRRSKDDFEYYEVVMEYVAGLQDVHTGYFLPSDFYAYNGLLADLYDGKPLIDFVDRGALPAAEYPIQPGDELISVDGQPVEDWIRQVSRLQSFGNPRSTARWALDQIFFRVQAALPRAHQVGEFAEVVVRHQNSAVGRYRIPWIKEGTPLEAVGPTPSPRLASAWAEGLSPTSDGEAPGLRSLPRLLSHRAPPWRRVRGFGRRSPVFAPPPGFVLRLGAGRNDFFFSGTYAAAGYRIGFLRIPDFLTAGDSTTTVLQALRQFENEILFFQQNTDGLVLDLMRNPGGLICYTEELLRRVIPYRFRTLGDEIRPSFGMVAAARADVEEARQLGFPQWVLDLLGVYAKDLETAYREEGGRTGPLPLCSLSLDLDPATGPGGARLAYSKPMLVLADEFSTSAAELFLSVIQDNERAPVFGLRTTGGGGAVSGVEAGFYAEGFASVTRTLGIRKRPVFTSEYPPAPYIENIGVRPDIYADYMTAENLLQGGRPFVDGFTQAMIDTIQGR